MSTTATRPGTTGGTTTGKAGGNTPAGPGKALLRQEAGARNKVLKAFAALRTVFGEWEQILGQMGHGAMGTAANGGGAGTGNR